ncbi:MAG: BamA/TamA family outer membrane protein [Saprospirales bacterium]|nr:BamA/TamA family outer membrane protein [Saprospirales bacterium]MBK8921758.1 BamA/TamA family outer membrane protein [Saprospirales bacterium]
MFSALLTACHVLYFHPARAQTGAQPPLFVRIDSILLEGNRKTRPSLILRELEFSAGDTLALTGIAETLERNRLRVMNTNLFSSSTVSLDTLPGNRLGVRFQLVETWYIYPIPLFELADRNFNVWWTEFNRSLKRVNYGISWTHLNLSGHADILKLNLNFGYSNRYEIVYERPWFNRRQTLGFRIATGFVRTHEVSYRTAGNKQLFAVDPDAWQRKRYYANMSLKWRPKLLTNHSLSLEYHQNTVADSIAAEINPDYFLQGRSRQRHFSLIYRLEIDRRDIRPYPLNGWLGIFELRKNGLLPTDDLQLLRLGAELKKYFGFSRRLSLETVVKTRFSFPRRRPPFFNNQALGYGNDLVRGYEFYVMDGLDYGLLRSSLHIGMLDHTFRLGRLMPLQAFRVMPLKIYVSINNDLGYANDPYYATGNPLTNRLLRGHGIGIDVVAFYDKVARFEWSWRGNGGNGFFVNINTGI